MRVLIDHAIFAAQRFGGVSRMFYELARRLAARGDVELLLYAGFHVNGYPLAGLRGEAARFFGWRLPPFRGSARLLEPLNRLGLRLFRAGLDVDIYHPSHYSPLAARWRKSPLVLTVNDMIPERYPGDFRDIRRRLAVKKSCIARADLIVAISCATRHDLQDIYGIPENRIRVIYPGAPAPVAPGSLPPPDLPRPYFLYVGTRHQTYKNFGRLLSAYAASPACREADLVCFGGGGWSDGERRCLAGLGLETRVRCLGGDDRLLERLYAGALALVYPSLIEGFGLPPLEAMARGCPVLAGCDAGAVPEVLGEAALYFDPRDESSIGNCLDALLADRRQREQLTERGRIRAADFSWEQMTVEIERAYRELEK
jgi:glycosyltransferase involved in cell wall biosynthesis